MPLSELLNPDRIAVLGEAVDRDGVLAHAARLLAVDSVDDAAVIAECLRMRERLGSTAIGHGVAIPHGRCSAFDQQHLQLLSELAEVFAEPAFRQSLRAAPDTASLYAALQRGRG